MKINLAIIISLITLILGLIFKQPYLWIPITVLIAGLIDLFTRKWVTSNKLGTAIKFSISIKFVLMIIGLYGLVGQVACIGLAMWWLFL